MCGFVGFVNQIRDDGSVLNLMSNAIAHRGPDSSGNYIDEYIALGFRRLSIIDIKDGCQPMFNEDRSLVLVFNGEIYNYIELREELVKNGHIFKSHTDSEVLLHGFEEWGEDILQKLRGMFAFVLVNLNNKTIFGARDIFGIKPFYYTNTDDNFIFGSEIKSFLHHPKFIKRLNEQALAHYLSFQYSPTEETFFRGVYKLPPAHYFKYKDGKLLKKRYFKPDFNETSEILKYYTDKIDSTVKESVVAHKISDVEVGSFLSSGVDSSYIAAIANVDKTFTVGFEGNNNRYNEIDYAKQFASTIGVENISKVISAEEYWREFPKVQYYMDEPLADPSAVALYFVSKLASEHVKVVMSGEGADELFGGYKIYQEPITKTLYDNLPFKIRRYVSKICTHFPQRRYIHYLVRRGMTIEERFIGNANIFTKHERDKILKSETAKKALPPNIICSKYYDEVSDKDDITKMQYLDINMWLVGDILLKADKVSMANSLELRVPFLDKKVIGLAQTLPLSCRVNTHTTKLALRNAAEKTLPHITSQKEKLGFPVPIREWLKQEKYYNTVKDCFLSDAAERYFNTSKLIKLLNDHKNGKTDNSRKIWTVYTFLIWYKEFFKGEKI